jgi:hypothetical protein
MTARAEDLLTAEQRGRWSPWREAPPVTASDIRRWALAVYWPEQPPRRFLDDGAVATGSRRGGLVAPREFNPFAWLPDGAGGSTPLPPGVRRLFGGCRIAYGEDIAVGDVVRRRVRLDGWAAKSGSSGDFLVVHHTHEWRNQRDRLVRMAEYALIHRSTTRAPA